MPGAFDDLLSRADKLNSVGAVEAATIGQKVRTQSIMHLNNSSNLKFGATSLILAAKFALFVALLLRIMC